VKSRNLSRILCGDSESKPVLPKIRLCQSLPCREIHWLRINAETLKAIQKWTASEFCSVNGQIEWILNQGLKTQKKKQLKIKNS